MKQIAKALFLAVTLTSLHAADVYPSCDVRVSRNVRFSSVEAPDTAEVTVQGNPCYEGVLALVVKNSRGENVYVYEAPFKRHTATQWDDTDLGGDAKRVAEDFVVESRESVPEVLPKWLPQSEFYEATYCTSQVAEVEYRRLQSAGLPVLTHSTHYEGWRKVVFDPRSDSAIVVLECGL